MTTSATTTTMRYLAVATDMDGTLLHPQHHITDLTRRVLEHVQTQCGVPVVCATARHHVDMQATKARCRIPGYLMTSNGARVHDEAGRLLIQRNFAEAAARQLIALADDEPTVTLSFYQGDRWFISRYMKEVTAYYEDSEDALHYELYNAATHADYKDVFNVYFACDKDADDKDVADVLARLQQRIAAAFASDEVHLLPSRRALEVMPGGVNKASTLAMLLKQHVYAADADVSTRPSSELLRRCIVFGDGPNDYEMLMMCGKGYVMHGAHKRLLERLPRDAAHLEYIGASADDAVAVRLMQLFGMEASQL